MRLLIISFLLTFATGLQARLLDKILGVIDDQIITLSTVKRVQQNLSARNNISPQIYKNTKLTSKEIVSIVIGRHMIRAKLTELGYVISDDQVESRIKETEQRLGINRAALLQFLNSNNITFDEYFEIIRETIEYNIFVSRVIRPLISVTEQEIKNTFYKKNVDDKTLTFKYTLVDFSIGKDGLSNSDVKNMPDTLKSFQISGVLPKSFSAMQTNVLGDITEDGLTKELKSLLKNTNEGSFSSPILLGNDYHVFFVKKKDLVESEVFLKSKENIRMELVEKQVDNMTSLWLQRQQNKHYVKYFF